MSLFLGKIHYWLFNKILWFENLEEEIIKFAQENGLDVDSIRGDIESKYGKKLENKNLEEIIDTDNIHGWLQNRIHCAEGRMAAWTSFLIENGKIGDLEKIYVKQAKEAADEVKSERNVETATEIYDCMNDYILDGMPCDRVNEVIDSSEESIMWKRRVCVHKNIWENEGILVDVFYELREHWINAFVNTMNNDYEYVKLEDNIQSIRHKM